MKKRLLAGATALLLILPFTSVFAQNFTVSDTMGEALQQVYDDERYAQALYEGLADKFGDGPYAMLIRSEGRHAEAAKRVAERNGIALLENAVSVTIPETEAEGVQMAVQYEKEDIKFLEALIAKDFSQDVNRMLAHLKRGSEHHEQHMTGYAAALADGTAENWTAGYPMNREGGFGMGMGRGMWMGGHGMMFDEDFDFEEFRANREENGFGMGGPGMMFDEDFDFEEFRANREENGFGMGRGGMFGGWMNNRRGMCR